MNILWTNLSKWTPLSTIIVISVSVLGFVMLWDTVHNIALPPYVIGILSFILGGTGASGLITHGNNLANGNAETVAKASANATAEAIKEVVTANGKKA